MSDDAEEMDPPRGRESRRDRPPQGGRVKCDQPDCDYVAKNAMLLGAHKWHSHGIPGKAEHRRPNKGSGRRKRGPARGSEPRQPRPQASSTTRVTAAYARGKFDRFAKQLDRRDYRETANEIVDGIEDIAETMEELAKRSETANEVVKWVLLAIGSGAAILTFGAVLAAFRRDRARKLEARRAEMGEEEKQQVAQFGVRQFFGRRPGAPGSSAETEEVSLGLG